MPPPPAADAASAQADIAPGVRLGRVGTFDHPLRGILLILISTVFFAVSDTGAKVLTQTMPPMLVVWLRFTIGTAILLPVALATYGRPVLVSQRPVLQVVRAIGMLVSALFFVTGLSYLPVAEMTAINFVAPIFITALSVVLLRERVGVRRWAAAFAGLVGVAIILRPGTGSFNLAALFPIASSAVWAFAAVATRMMAGDNRPETTLIFSTIIPCLALTGALPLIWAPFGMREVLIAVFVGVTSTLGHWLVVRAFGRAPASTLAPFTYLQLLWATIVGWVVLGNLPDIWTYVGAAVIAASGLYTAHRERVRAKLG
jgi:drug/metabolite transporter (DMT)-like permease